MKGRKKMNFGNSSDLIEFGKVLIQWGIGFVGIGLGIVLVGALIVIIGKTCFEDKFNLLMATITYHLNK